jgi:1-hydroxycarotenoid 3,4-desaturase
LKAAGPRLAGISPFKSLWDELGGYFSDPRLRQLFGRYATYCGSSPFEAPATLMLIAHAELLGVWRVAGGMIRLAEALAALAVARGAKFVFGARVTEIGVAGGRVAFVRTAALDAAVDAVVANADLAAIDAGLLGAAARQAVAGMSRRARPSFSAVTWAMTGRAEDFALAHHNVVFARDCAAEFAALARGRVPAAPTVYVCAAEPGRFFCLVNAPADGARADAGCLVDMLGQLRRCGLDLQPDAVVRTDPAGWARKFPGTGGALYGRALAGWRDSFARPGARTKLPGFYLAGGGVHPGPGLPMAATSGRLAAECVLTFR